MCQNDVPRRRSTRTLEGILSRAARIARHRGQPKLEARNVQTPMYTPLPMQSILYLITAVSRFMPKTVHPSQAPIHTDHIKAHTDASSRQVLYRFHLHVWSSTYVGACLRVCSCAFSVVIGACQVPFCLHDAAFQRCTRTGHARTLRCASSVFIVS